MDKTAIAHWAPEIGGQFWWNGIFFVLIFVPFMLFIGKKLSSKQRDYMSVSYTHLTLPTTHDV